MSAFFLLLSIFVSFVVAMISLNWFFRDADDSTRSLQEFVEESWFGYWWMTKAGIWLGLSAGAGLVCFFALSLAWQWIISLL